MPKVFSIDELANFKLKLVDFQRFITFLDFLHYTVQMLDCNEKHYEGSVS